MGTEPNKGRGASRQSGDDGLPEKLASICGRICTACNAYQQGTCCGCTPGSSTARHGECPVLACCTTVRQLEHCGLCLDFPCQVFVSHAPPREIARLYKALRRRADIGTSAWLDEQQ
jgi:hypothetical protein